MKLAYQAGFYFGRLHDYKKHSILSVYQKEQEYIWIKDKRL